MEKRNLASLYNNEELALKEINQLQDQVKELLKENEKLQHENNLLTKEIKQIIKNYEEQYNLFNRQKSMKQKLLQAIQEYAEIDEKLA